MGSAEFVLHKKYSTYCEIVKLFRIAKNFSKTALKRPKIVS